MNNDDLINSVLREYGYEGLIGDASTTSIQQVEGGTITAARPLVSSDAPMLESPTTASEVVEPVESIDLDEMFDDISSNDEEQEEFNPADVADYEISVAATPAPDLDEETRQVIHYLAERIANESNVPDNLQMERVDNNETLSIEGLAVPDDPTNIPVNKTSVDVDEKTLRFSGAEWYDKIQQQTIVLAGLGGIGSWTAMMLSRMQPSQLIMYDDDTIDRTNLAGQLYSQLMVGRKKVDGIASMLNEFSDFRNVIAIPRRIEGLESECTAPIMVCGFDNMVARKKFFELWCEFVNEYSSARSNCLFIDGRLNMEELQIYCIQGNDDYHIDKYANEALFNDEDAESDICSMKQTTYCSAMIGALIANLVVNHLSNIVADLPFPIRSLPYFTYYSANMMYFKMDSQ